MIKFLKKPHTCHLQWEESEKSACLQDTKGAALSTILGFRQYSSYHGRDVGPNQRLPGAHVSRSHSEREQPCRANEASQGSQTGFTFDGSKSFSQPIHLLPRVIKGQRICQFEFREKPQVVCENFPGPLVQSVQNVRKEPPRSNKAAKKTQIGKQTSVW